MNPREDPPPVMGTWSRIYMLVLGALVLWIILLAILGRVFR